MKVSIRQLPVHALYLMTFGLAAGSKWASGGVPGWFRTQFGGTFLNAFPGALVANYYLIALLETVVTAFFAASLLRDDPRWLRRGLWLAQAVFVMLGFGLRMTGDFNGAANLFMYCGITWLIDRASDEKSGR